MQQKRQLPGGYWRLCRFIRCRYVLFCCFFGGVFFGGSNRFGYAGADENIIPGKKFLYVGGVHAFFVESRKDFFKIGADVFVVRKRFYVDRLAFCFFDTDSSTSGRGTSPSVV